MENEEYLIYLRKSQADNPEDSIESVLEKHEIQLQEYAESIFGYRIPEDCIYREVVSGETLKDRIMIGEVLKRIEYGSTKGVLTIEPQRLGRGDLEDCGKIVNAFRYTDTLVVTPVKTYDLSDKYDRKFFEMELQRGADYLEYYKEIQARGRIASVKRGNFIGSIAPYGYKKIQLKENGKKYFTLEICDEEAAVVRMIFDLYVNKNYGFRKIATKLDDLNIKPRIAAHWSPPALKEMLENPVYIGKIRWNWRKTVKKLENGIVRRSRPKSDPAGWILVDGKHPPIITEKLFDKALAKKGQNVRVTAKANIRNPWSGLLYCSCGRAMSYRSYTRNGKQSANPRLLCDGQIYCHNKSICYQEFEDCMLDTMKKTIQQFQLHLETMQAERTYETYQLFIKSCEKKLSDLEKRENEQYEFLEEGLYTKEIFKKRNKLLHEERQAVLSAIDHARNETPKPVDYEEKIMHFSNAIEALKNPSVSTEQKNNLLKKCFSKVTYSNQKTEDSSGTDGFIIKVYSRI